MYIVASGYLVEGWTFYGPFKSEKIALNWCHENKISGTVIKLDKPM